MKNIYLILEGTPESLKELKEIAYHSDYQAFCIKKIIGTNYSPVADIWYYKHYLKLKQIPKNIHLLHSSTYHHVREYSIKSVLLKENSSRLEYYIEMDSAQFQIDFITTLFPKISFSTYERDENSNGVYVESFNRIDSTINSFFVDDEDWGIVTQPLSVISLKEFYFKLKYIQENNINALKQSINTDNSIDFESLFPDYNNHNKAIFQELYELEYEATEILDKVTWFFGYPSYANIWHENYWELFCLKHNLPLQPSDIELEIKLENDWWQNLPYEWVEMLKESNQYNPRKDINSITKIEIRTMNIINILPIKFLKNLKKAIINIGNLADIRPISSLTKLEYLDISHNEIFDISPLKYLKSLKELHLQLNQIENINPILDLKELKFVNVSHNRIESIESISHFKNLRNMEIIGDYCDSIVHKRFANI